CPYIVQEEVAVRMNDFVADRRGYGKRAAIDLGTRWRGRDGTDMANVAADRVEDLRSCLRIRCRRQSSVARRHLGGSHKRGELIDVLQSIGRIGIVFRIRSGLADRSCVGGIETIGDALLVQVGIAGEGKQAGVLVFPAKPSDTRLAG